MVIQRLLGSLRVKTEMLSVSGARECSTGRDDFFQRSGQDGKLVSLCFVCKNMKENSCSAIGHVWCDLKDQQNFASLKLGTDPLERWHRWYSRRPWNTIPWCTRAQFFYSPAANRGSVLLSVWEMFLLYTLKIPAPLPGWVRIGYAQSSFTGETHPES